LCDCAYVRNIRGQSLFHGIFKLLDIHGFLLGRVCPASELAGTGLLTRLVREDEAS
jgi:hypothetical protein